MSKINISSRPTLAAALPYVSLILWIVPLLFFSNGQDSFMPQDEAMYAVRARWMLESGDWLTPQSWGELVYEKTPGPYWILAFFYTLFGISEATSRLPAQIACIISLLLTYEIGAIFFNRRIAWLGATILGVSFLWLQSSRLATANILMISMMLLGIWCLLKAELHPKHPCSWSYVAGLSFGLGFLIRGQMIFVPLSGMLPYLIYQHRRHPHLTNPMLYLGFAISLFPSVAWFLVSWHRYGQVVFDQFFALVVRIASEQRNGNSPFFYLWNTPIKAFPWAIFSILGLILVSRPSVARKSIFNPSIAVITRNKTATNLILVACPLIMLVQISLVSTRLPHYALVLYPFMALLAAVALEWLGKMYETREHPHKSIPRALSYIFGGLGCLLSLAGGIIFWGIPLPGISADLDISKYGLAGLVLGLGWLTLPLLWISRHRWGNKSLTANYWLSSWLVPAWLTLAVAGSTGLLGDYNPDVKAFLQQPEVAAIVQNNTIHFVVQETQALKTGGDKPLLLLTFYTPHWGQRFHKLEELPPANYAWVSPDVALKSDKYRIIRNFRNWLLVISD
ncbi:MAG: glycosyltransferase family 39 protein [Nostocaceae cyanobacterium]|nr:glycosyltransferase family 39 protein [Nostocaceae cyanobacterium]